MLVHSIVHFSWRKYGYQHSTQSDETAFNYTSFTSLKDGRKGESEGGKKGKGRKEEQDEGHNKTFCLFT